MTIEQYLVSAVIALGGCVGTLFLWIRQSFQEVVAKLNDCEEDREKLWLKMTEVIADRRKDP